MKLHRNLVVAVISGLKEVLLDKKQADITVGNLLQSNKNWGSRDRNFIADNIYSIIRYKRFYEYCLNDELFGEVSLWKLFGTKMLLNNISLPDWKEFAELDKEKILSLETEAKAIRKIRESVPDWLDELGEKELGGLWEKEIAALNKPATFSIRVNTLKTNFNIIKKMFTDEGIE